MKALELAPSRKGCWCKIPMSLTDRCSVCSGQLGGCEGILREARGRAENLKTCRHWSARAKGGMASTGVLPL
jgi:hypothetical protein